MLHCYDSHTVYSIEFFYFFSLRGVSSAHLLCACVKNQNKNPQERLTVLSRSLSSVGSQSFSAVILLGIFPASLSTYLSFYSSSKRQITVLINILAGAPMLVSFPQIFFVEVESETSCWQQNRDSRSMRSVYNLYLVLNRIEERTSSPFIHDRYLASLQPITWERQSQEI